MASKPSAKAVHRFFAGLTEYAFHCRLGVVEPSLVDYIAGLLTNFIRSDAIYSLRAPTGKRLDQVVEMLSEAEMRQGTAKRDAHRHIGDFTLFWTGLYPEAVERMQQGSFKDSLIDYRTQGKRAYHIASTIPSPGGDARPELLRRLSHEFELCAYGLGEVRREWERRGEGGDAILPIWVQ